MQNEAWLMTCGMCCVWPAFLGAICFYAGKNWGKFKIQSPVVVDKPKPGAPAQRDPMGSSAYGTARQPKQ
jgi:hypothetical protein